jgi:cellulose synthase/poly-beta-1,6-N-acetylglucosamine synthase-like glycosyltransferase
MLVFYFFAAIAVWLGVLSLRGGVRFQRHVRTEIPRTLTDYQPFASVIAPFRGIDQGFRENVEALFEQYYAAYEIIFVTDRNDDPGIAVLEEIQQSSRQKNLRQLHCPESRIIIAGAATDSGQKVHNLRQAVKSIAPKSDVIVFVDTDARPHVCWLQFLVAPLQDKQMGASSGYRWFVAENGGFASGLRAVWNASIASALGASDEKNFCWGGSTAIRRTTFEALNVSERWRGTVSDDFTLTQVLREAGLPIHFVPYSLTASFGDCGFRELLEFTNRQLKITRVYAGHLWKAVLLGSLLFVPVFFGGIVLVVVRALLGKSIIAPGVLLAVIFLLGAAKSWIRLRAVSRALVAYQSPPRKASLAHLFLWPVASVLFLYNALVAASSRRITWRGISYELKSPTEAVIISRES